MGFSSKILNLIAVLYKDTKMKIWNGNKLSSSIKVNKGVKQGCILSPLLFALYMNDLEGALKGSVEFGDGHKRERIKVIMYADDIAIVAESSDKLKMI